MKHLPKLHMPDEGDTHERTWMAFVASPNIWLSKQIPEVKRNLVTIAQTIAKYEPVSMLVNSTDYDEALRLLGNAHRHPISLVKTTVDDLWLRDTGPTFAYDTQQQKVAIDFNFNGWGNKQAHSNDAKIARVIAKLSNTPSISSTLVLEGGCFEVDGQGTAIMTKSCIVNRNPDVSLGTIENQLKHLLGLKKSSS